MKKALAILALGAFSVSAASPALACMGGRMAEAEPAPITTALETEPVTSKPAAGSGS